MENKIKKQNFRFENEQLVDRETGKVFFEKPLDCYYKDSRDNIMMTKQYNIVFEDVDKTHNLNMHSSTAFAYSFEEAYGKILLKRPEFKTRNIQLISIEEF